jgi:glycosyltransferase involved in cell wall biosynthesis
VEEKTERTTRTAKLERTTSAARVPVTVVVPCFNEERSLGYLAKTLHSVAAALRRDYELAFVFVDDASRDGTWDLLNRLFGSRSDCTLLRHDRNRGVAAAILTGLRAAGTEIVCSIDCDCTYDPHRLAEMIPRLTDGVDLVTASPYHPAGRVLNVPAWRLALSRGASFLYRRVLRQKLHTYTSCFRVYRRQAVAGLPLREEGFLGVAEMLARLDLQGSVVVEHPATLEVRLLGHSKMKVLHSVAGHLKLLARLAALRLGGQRPLRSGTETLRPIPSGAHHE